MSSSGEVTELDWPGFNTIERFLIPSVSAEIRSAFYSVAAKVIVSL
jgi:hypothetical protein